MKKKIMKGLAFMLAATLVLAMLPTAGATETEPTYEYVFTTAAIGKEAEASVNFANTLTCNSETGKWSASVKVSSSVYKFFPKGYKLAVKGDSGLLGSNGTAFKLTVDKPGVYKPTLTYFKHRSGGKINIYLVDANITTVSTAAELKTVTANPNNTDMGITLLGAIETRDTNATKEWMDEYKRTSDSELSQIELKAQDYYLVVAIDGANSETYNADDYIIEPGEGEVKSSIIYYINSFGLTKVETSETEEDEQVSGDVSFVATSNVGENELMTVEAENFTYDKLVDTVPAGTYVKVTAPAKEGYEFKHWVRGSKDNGVYVSSDNEYSFTALTHTFLTAIYEDVTNVDSGDIAVVEFYNGNGQYLDKATSTIGGTVSLPETAPTLTGFEFANRWETEDGEFTAETQLTRALTRAVAKYNSVTTTFNVTDHNGNEHKLTYGSEIECTSDSDVYWIRDNTVVDYGKTYTYAAWDDTVIEASQTGEIKPVVLLDTNDKSGARMIEYDDGGKNLIEVGIIFGDTADIEIGSCSSKATSQKNAGHGQFTAKPNGDEAYARGYLIYEEDGVYKVVYSK